MKCLDEGVDVPAREIRGEQVPVVVNAPHLREHVADLAGALHTEGLQHDADKRDQPDDADGDQQNIDQRVRQRSGGPQSHVTLHT